MNKNLIIIFFFLFQFCQSQSIKNDWGKFYCENWNVKIESNKTVFLEKIIQFNVSFNNKKGNSRDVNYYVFLKI